MKNAICILLILFLGISSCQKEETNPSDSCQLTKIDRGNGNIHIYTYDAKGKIIKMERDLDQTGNGNFDKHILTFEYDNSGKLAKTYFMLNGIKDGFETYNYSNGVLSKIKWEYVDGYKGENNLKFDSFGRLTEYTIEPTDNGISSVSLFKYDINGIMVKAQVKDFQGKLYQETIIKPAGISKSPEEYLIKSGLPYDILLGQPWSINTGSVGTITSSGGLTELEEWIDLGSTKIIGQVVDKNGYTIENQVESPQNKIRKGIFTLSNCE